MIGIILGIVLVGLGILACILGIMVLLFKVMRIKTPLPFTVIAYFLGKASRK